jgi:sulfite exporter TauE/SafE
LIGVAFGIAVFKLEAVESFRGNLAGWAMIAFGLAYTTCGIRRALKSTPHEHFHAHDDDTLHKHSHSHFGNHAHVHDTGNETTLTPWVLFTIFVLGPCEPLIPILIYPAAQQNAAGLILATSVFAIATLLTMLGVVMAVSYGINPIPARRLERYSHVLAGASILACGAAIQFLGL